ncbi:hypothetical protein [Cerasicoccus fimbriatus]|uniref:hypothetical protein n=1 Tax=Cerasicoccus fimbriatus TaxID=3014554 RepID=UPI0022B5D12D|nr:hypothetical protein [Cerasicoccus sp. TK19100]
MAAPAIADDAGQTVSIGAGQPTVELVEAPADTVPEVELEARIDPETAPDRDYLFSLLRYLYRWHIDAAMLAEDLDAVDSVVIAYRELHPVTDESDNSRFAEIIVPIARTRVMLKQADYSIEELGLEVKNQRFNVVNVIFDPDLEWDHEDYLVQVFTIDEVFDWLHETRNDILFPNQELLTMIRDEVREEVGEERPDLVRLDEPQIVYLAPVSPVINEVWIYWESGQHLVHFTSDDDLGDIDTWRSELHHVELFDLKNDVVVSPLEKPGSNAYITKDWAGRVLFNCNVLGAKLILPPEGAANDAVIIEKAPDGA